MGRMDRTGGPSRRALMIGGLAALTSGCSPDTSELAATAAGAHAKPAAEPAAGPAGPSDPLPKPNQAWRILAAGNDRFAAGKATHPHQSTGRRERLVSGQHPFACVLGCVDSRVPPELIFDQGFGDLLTVRSAGEVLDDAVVGSVEYGVVHLGIPLVVVLGHIGCGAVEAAVELVHGRGELHGDVSAVVHAIESTVRATKPDADAERFLAACVAAQAERVATELRERSYAIDTAIGEGRMLVKPVVYDIRSGRVDNA